MFWPFVHWLPHGSAVSIMGPLKARSVITAHSVTLWKLRRWFQEFEVTNAVPIILRHPEDYGRKHFLWRVLAHLPSELIDALTVLSPGFVFILRKQAPPM